MDVEHERLGNDKVVISLKDFEDMLDIIAYDQAKLRTETSFPVTATIKIIQGEAPLKTFRKHHNMSQAELSKRSGVPQGLISEIETGKKQGSVTSLKALADTLQVQIDDLL